MVIMIRAREAGRQPMLFRQLSPARMYFVMGLGLRAALLRASPPGFTLSRALRAETYLITIRLKFGTNSYPLLLSQCALMGESRLRQRGRRDH